MINFNKLAKGLPMLIQTFEQLEEWIEENNYFEEGHILQIESNPLAITVGYMVEGNYEVNTERSILTYKITPSKVLKWNYSPEEFTPSEDAYIDGIEPLKVEKGIALQFQVPPEFQLVAESFTISDPKIIKSTFKPWLSDREIFAEAPMDHIPKPNYWKEKLRESGHDIVFRYYMGEGKQPDEIPYPDYSGYFIQLANKIRDTKEGIFIKHISIHNGVVKMAFVKQDNHLEDVWESLKKIIADIPEVQISCGNCKFSGDEWKQQNSN